MQRQDHRYRDADDHDICYDSECRSCLERRDSIDAFAVGDEVVCGWDRFAGEDGAEEDAQAGTYYHEHRDVDRPFKPFGVVVELEEEQQDDHLAGSWWDCVDNRVDVAVPLLTFSDLNR